MLRLILFLIMLGRGLTKETLLVQTTQGPVVGYKEPGDDVFEFHGIPYATAPTGENKYKPPLPAPIWSKPFHAIKKNISCLQMKNYLITIPDEVQTEDCLVANVYVPDTREENLPVFVHIHGGAYIFGNGDFLKGKNLIRRRAMIIVNFNYRLGPHGFLCLGTPDVPGNAGMKDQVALLRWVQNNIASFGGNPDDVTISGFSSSSAAVELLTLSPITIGLFNKAILESGASVAAFSTQINPVKNAEYYANLLNFNSGDVSSLEEFYKSVPNDVLYSVDVYNATDTIFFFSPCVERDLGQEIFLDDSPVNILKNGKQNKLPMLFGFTEMDGLFRIPLFDTWKDRMNEKFSDFLPGDLHFKDEMEREEVAQKVKQFYFGKQAVSEETIFRYIDYFTDTVFAYPTLRSVRLQVESGNENIYLYRFDFVDKTASPVPYTCVRGADHCAQTLAVMDGVISSLAEASTPQPLNEESLSRDYKKMKDIMRFLWATFITTSKPVPEDSSLPKWPPTQANGGPYMRLDKSLKLRGPLIQQRVLFWDDIYDKYYNYPSPPSHTNCKRNIPFHSNKKF